MNIQFEPLTSQDLADFDSANFEPEHAMDRDEWDLVLRTGHISICTARNEDNELAAVCVLKFPCHIFDLCYCFSIAVSEKYRGKRLGSRVYRYAIEGSMSVGKIQAHCAVDNVASIFLHQSVGFKSVQYINDFYGDYMDAILWERER